MVTIKAIQTALDNANHRAPKVTQLQPSAVLVPLVERANGLQLILTQRAQHLKHHPGQISFPGGRMDDSDKNLIHTAIRETEEEVGIYEHQIEVIGKLALQPTITQFMIQPVVGIVKNDYQFTVNTDEVDEAFEVPLDFLFDPTNRKKSYREFQGIKFPLYSMPYQGRNIWGATAQIIVSFSKLLS
ncbi:CoA pyrophosphatase [Kangiella sp. HZ709]|uniref:CoA pyrophosphatase n=1 Tax=Kangiella sp. HZ709 TaxID=2666328 RepID=UPI0012AF1542|nr:CoA pyrophosphatase [Kangiella sp. HZ709]MRX26579.1 CoA pyrophosphatase [Kangiella sp. HZ709]